MAQKLLQEYLIEMGRVGKILASTDLRRSSRWTLVAFVLLIVILLGGCGRRAAQMPPQQIVVQVDSQAKQNRLQEQLMKQVAHPSVVDSRNYKIGPEDLLEVNFLDAEKLRREVRVDGDGKISLLLVGPVAVAGLTPVEIEQKLTNLYREGDYLRNPQINVAVKEYCHQKVAVTGAVNKPEHYPLIGSRSLLEVLGMAGGVSDKGGEVVHIIRARKGSPASKAASPKQSFSPGTETVVVDLNRLLLKGAAELNYPIENGDVVHVPFAKTVHVLGAVAKPGTVSLKDNMTVTKAVAQAGGLHIMLSSYNANIMRLDETGQRQTIPVNLAQIAKGNGEDVPLKENDIVYVQESGVRRFLFDFKMLLPGSISVAPAGMM